MVKIFKLLVGIIAFFCATCLMATGCIGPNKDSKEKADSIAETDTLTYLYQDDAFGQFLKALPRKKRVESVKLFNGEDAGMEGTKYCVIDFPLLSDIEQCADVCMHLRAEYLFERGDFNKIQFHDYGGKVHAYTSGNDRRALERFLRGAFGFANTYTLQQDMYSVGRLREMRPGDMLIMPAEGNMLGHTVMIMEVAKNKDGDMMYQVAQGYTPACDLHIVRNTSEHRPTPWFRLEKDAESVYIAGYTFHASQLKRWK